MKLQIGEKKVRQTKTHLLGPRLSGVAI